MRMPVKFSREPCQKLEQTGTMTQVLHHTHAGSRETFMVEALAQSFARVLCPSAPSCLSLALSSALNPSSDNISSVCSPRDKMANCELFEACANDGEVEGVLDREGCGCGTA